MNSATTTTPRHHSGWREVRTTVLAGPEGRQADQKLAPRFIVVRQLIALGCGVRVSLEPTDYKPVKEDSALP